MAAARTRPTTDTAVNPAAARRASRTRRWLAPVWGAGWLAVVAWIGRALLDTSARASFEPWFLATSTLAVVIVALLITRHVDHRQERIAALTALAAATGWMHAVWWAWAEWDSLMGWLAVGTVLAVGAQALNEREWARHKIDRDQQAWPRLMAGTVWADTFPVGAVERLSEGVKRTRYRRKDLAMTSVSDLMDPKSIVRYEERHDLPHGSVRVARDGKSTKDVLVTVVTRDPHAQVHRTRDGLDLGLVWDGRHVDDVFDEIVLGLYEDGDAETTVAARAGIGGVHRLIAGVTRSGKSTLMMLLVMALAPARNACLHMIDCKGGMSFAKLASLFSWFEYEPTSAVDMLEGFVQLIRQRSHWARERGYGNRFPLSPDHPLHVVFIDELAKLIGTQAEQALYPRALKALIEIIQTGAGLGVVVVAATQFPTIEALGSTQFRSQIDWRACFRLAEADTGGYILTGANPKHIEPANIDSERNGTCYVQQGNKVRPATLRVFHITDGCDETGQPVAVVPDLITPFVARYWDRTCPVPEEEAEVLDHHGAWSARTIYGPDGSTWAADPFDPEETDAVIDSEPAQIEAPRLHAVPDPEDTPADRVSLADLAAVGRTEAMERADREALARMETLKLDDPAEPEPSARDAAWALIVAAGRAGLTPADIYRDPSVKRSDSWGYKRIAEWRDNGDLVSLGGARYRAADHHLRRAGVS